MNYDRANLEERGGTWHDHCDFVPQLGTIWLILQSYCQLRISYVS